MSAYILKVKLNRTTGKYYIEMNSKFAKRAENTLTKEYERLQAVREDYPEADIVIRHIAKKANQERYRGLTYEYMEDYIRTHEPQKTREAAMNEYYELKLISECHSKPYRYPTIKKWFLNKYPELKQFGIDNEKTEGDPAAAAA